MCHSNFNLIVGKVIIEMFEVPVTSSLGYVFVLRDMVQFHARFLSEDYVIFTTNLSIHCYRCFPMMYNGLR